MSRDFEQTDEALDVPTPPPSDGTSDDRTADDGRSDDGRTADDASWGGPISRRTFVRLSAATGAALTLPGNAASAVTSEKFDAEYEYVQNHTPLDYAVPTLVTFADPTGPDALAAALDADVVTTTEPVPAAYGRFTADQASTAADLPTAEELSHSPGSNPFWRLGYYPLGVFPEPRRSADFVDFEQMVDGLGYLAEQHADRMRAYSIGTSPGHHNYVSDRDDPKGVWVAEVTNDIEDEESFREKTKVMYSLSLHGLERAGAEAGSRFIEAVLRGDESDLNLDDVVLVFCFTNPDGWVAKHPQYGSRWQLGQSANPPGPVEDVPFAPFYERGNDEVFDTNRQYPTVGYITTDHYPGEPERPADRSVDRVPDALAIVEHFRGYENLDYGADLHGMLNASQFVLGLISQDQFDTRQLHELYEMNRVIDADLEAELDTWTTLADVQQRLTGDTNVASALPETAYDYSTIWDTIGYTVSGAMGDWMAHPEELGGLGMTTMDFEMAYSHMVGANVYDPELVRMQVIGYQTAIRTLAEYAVKNSDTPNTDDEFSVATETGGDSVAYVTTGEPGTDDDVLRRHDGQLVFVTYEDIEGSEVNFEGVVGPGAEYAGVVQRSEHPVTAPAEADRIDVTLSWGANVQDNDFFLENAAGDRVASSTNFGGPERIAADVEAGADYTLVVETWANAASAYEITGSFQRAVTDGGSNTESSSSSSKQSLAAGDVTAATYDVAEGLHTLSVHVHVQEALLETELVSPSGDVVRSFDPDGDGPVGGRCCSHPEWSVPRPEAGTWTVRVQSLLSEATTVELGFGTLQSQTLTPDPSAALGYDQQSYDVTPFRFFEEYADYVDDGGTIDWVTAEDVANGALVDRGAPAYDHVVVVHDEVSPPATDDSPGNSGDSTPEQANQGGTDAGGDTRERYLGALDEYVESGGNLVLTDTGVRLLSGLQNDLVADIGSDHLSDRVFDLAHLEEKILDHPLLTDVRPIQKSLWKVAPLGYNVAGEAPMTLVDESAFGESGGDVAATTGGMVSLGSITRDGDDGTGVHVVGGLLPPANQGNLHPFGLLDYTTSFLGYLVFTNALGFQQVVSSGDGQTMFGRGDEFNLDS